MRELLPYLFSGVIGVILTWLGYSKWNSGKVKPEDSAKVKDLKTSSAEAANTVATAAANHDNAVEVLNGTAESSKGAADKAAERASEIKKEIEEIKKTSPNLTVEEQKEELRKRGFTVEDW